MLLKQIKVLNPLQSVLLLARIDKALMPLLLARLRVNQIKQPIVLQLMQQELA